MKNLKEKDMRELEYCEDCGTIFKAGKGFREIDLGESYYAPFRFQKVCRFCYVQDKIDVI